MSEKFVTQRNLVKDALSSIVDEKLREQAMDALDELEDLHVRVMGSEDESSSLLTEALAVLEECFQELHLSEEEIEERLGLDLFEYRHNNRIKAVAE